MTDKISLINRALIHLNPEFAYKRIAWENYIRSAYDSGSNRHQNSGWHVVNSPAEMTNQGERDIIRARTRDLERNSNMAESIVQAFERNVVGTGITLQARVKISEEEENEVLNKQIEKKFKQWNKKKYCDISERQSFTELAQMAMRRLKVDGGILFIKIYDTNSPYRFKLQAREIDDLDSTKFYRGSGNENYIINGIEIDKFNRHVAYWIRTTSPDGLYTKESQKIPAENVLYLQRIKRPSQIREISELAPTANEVKNVNEYIEAISIKERILACFSIFIKKNTAPGGVGRGFANTNTNKPTNATEPKEKTIAPGIINYLEPGDDIAVANPNGQATNAKEFVMFNQRLTASGQGLSYETVSRDLSQVNYSSARQGLLDDQITYKVLQKFLIENLFEPVYEEFMEAMYLTGQLDLPDFYKNKEKYLECDWITPGWSWIDPLKEVKANEVALNTNQMTLAELAASNGKDWREVMKQRKKEKELEKQYGLEPKETSKNDEETDKLINEDTDSKKTS
ncbi:MAG: phage portal protein [Candidatus Gastranaerophilaceae bacterium]